MLRPRYALPAVALALTLTGCGTDPEPAAEPAVATATPGTPAPATPAAPPPSIPPSPAEHRFGKAVKTSDNSAVATALAYRQPVAKGAPRPEGQRGYVWGAAEVRVCVKVPDLTASRWPWVLTYPDGTIIEPSHTGYEDFPKPEYPWDDQPVKLNRCVRGWITFPVPAGKRPTYVQYQPTGMDPIEWRIR